MRLTRRAVLESIVAVAVVDPGPGISDAPLSVSLFLYDSRFVLSTLHARMSDSKALDLALEDHNLWRGLRGQHPVGRIVGVTRWQELVIVRGWFEADGKRLVSEQQLKPHELFRWEMI